MAVDLGYVILIGLGSVRITQLYKEITRRIGLFQPAWWKSFINLLCCVLLVLLVQNRSAEARIFIALAASGLAMLAHGLESLMRGYRDEAISEVVGRQPRRTR
jgi:hypothetical protein